MNAILVRSLPAQAGLPIDRFGLILGVVLFLASSGVDGCGDHVVLSVNTNAIASVALNLLRPVRFQTASSASRGHGSVGVTSLVAPLSA